MRHAHHKIFSWRKLRRGLTLIELIVVIGIIVTLVAIIILAVNPGRQFAQSRNARRQSDVKTLHDALQQVTANINDAISAKLSTEPRVICNKKAGVTCPPGSLDLREDLVPSYISDIPVDPNGTTADTGYVAFKDRCGGSITVVSILSELQKKIAAGVALGLVNNSANEIAYVSTLAGVAQQGNSMGDKCTAQFSTGRGAAMDSQGNIFLADYANHRIKKLDQNNNITIFAGGGVEGWPPPGLVDGNGENARFSYPFNLDIDSADNLYVADDWNRAVRKITPNADVTTLYPGPALGRIFAVAVDTLGNVYFTSFSFGNVYKIPSGGGAPTLFASGLSSHHGIATDSNNNVYVADTNNHRIVKITPSGTSTTFAGAGTVGSADGPAASATFNFPTGVAVDSQDNVYVSDYSNCTIRKATQNGIVSTVAGTPGVCGYADGTGSQARFNGAYSVDVDKSDNLIVGDGGNSKYRKITFFKWE